MVGGRSVVGGEGRMPRLGVNDVTYRVTAPTVAMVTEAGSLVVDKGFIGSCLLSG
jgi:hypothetical protein